MQNAVIPRLKFWIRKVVSEEDDNDVAKKSNLKPTLAEEAAAAAKAAAAAAADVANASQEMLNSRKEGAACTLLVNLFIRGVFFSPFIYVKLLLC